MIRPMQGQWLPAPSVLLNDNGSRNYWSVYNTAEQNAAASYPRLSHQGVNTTTTKCRTTGSRVVPICV